MDNGDCVVVVNAEKIVVTRSKEEQKTYFVTPAMLVVLKPLA